MGLKDASLKLCFPSVLQTASSQRARFWVSVKTSSTRTAGFRGGSQFLGAVL